MPFVDTNIPLYAVGALPEEQDMSNEQDYDGLRVINPFEESQLLE